jgi:hypothetical protein
MLFADGRRKAKRGSYPFMKFLVRQSDVFVWGSLKGRRAKLVLAASAVRISTVVVDGEGFRSLRLLKGAVMCKRVVNTLVKFQHTDPQGQAYFSREFLVAFLQIRRELPARRVSQGRPVQRAVCTELRPSWFEYVEDIFIFRLYRLPLNKVKVPLSLISLVGISSEQGHQFFFKGLKSYSNMQVAIDLPKEMLRVCVLLCRWFVCDKGHSDNKIITPRLASFDQQLVGWVRPNVDYKLKSFMWISLRRIDNSKIYIRSTQLQPIISQ